MKKRCKIKKCPVNNEYKNFVFSSFSVPYEPNARKKWIEIIEKHQEFDYLPQTYELCELHFDPEDVFQRGYRTLLKSGSLPKYFENLDLERLTKNNDERTACRKKRLASRLNAKLKSNQKRIKQDDTQQATSVELAPNFDFVAVKSEPDELPVEYEYNGTACESVAVCDASTQTDDVPRNKATQLQCQRTTNSPSCADEPTVCITKRQYELLLKSNVDAMKYAETIRNLKKKEQQKNIEIKRLQSESYYLKAKIEKLEKQKLTKRSKQK